MAQNLGLHLFPSAHDMAQFERPEIESGIPFILLVYADGYIMLYGCCIHSL